MSTSFDFGQKIGSAPLIAPDTYTAAENSVAVDTSDFEGVAVVAQVGAVTVTDIAATPLELKYFEGDDTTFGNATEVDAKYVIKNPEINSADACFVASVKTNKRYLFVQLQAPDNGGATLAVSAALGYPDNMPV